MAFRFELKMHGYFKEVSPMKTIVTAVLILFASVALASAEGVQVKKSTCMMLWDAPQTNADGTTLLDLKEYGVYAAPTQAGLATAVPAVVNAPALDPPSGATGSLACNQWALGQHYFQVDAVDTTGNRSVRTAVVPFFLLPDPDGVAPSAPLAPRATGP